MTKKNKTPSFSYSYELKIEKYQKDLIDKRLKVGKRLYNLMLKEAFKRQKNFHDYPLYRQFIIDKSYLELNQIKKLVGFTEYSFHKFMTQLRKPYSHLIDSFTAQKIASRAWKAISEYQYAKKGKPRFKKFIKSLEGKDNSMGIRFINGNLVWGKIKIEVKFNKKDEVEEYSLTKRVKYCRILKKEIRGKQRYYLQTILEGKALIKEKQKLGKEVVGLDLGPQTLAITTKKYASLRIFASELDREIKGEKVLQKLIDKKKRQQNPENYNKKNQIKKSCKWNKSKKLIKNESKLRELKRKNKERRKELHGRLINELLTLGVNFQIEKINYTQWQKIFGKSIGAKAPGLFVQMLRRKAENAGGEVIEFDTYKTKLSQVCLCGRIRKKSLSERIHKCECGVEIQRDILSSYLGIFVKKDKVNLEVARSYFKRFEQPYRYAFKELLGLRSDERKTLGLLKSEIETQHIKRFKGTLVV